ncbi:MAG: LacI family DNA-binding transcriptional regulator [Propionibacteriaceae bacterium]|jgi:LacI family transcriptional regulator|nr:LacI family DNA-binding transcriptional regulator [Propionibacteriaceae bacterium]
MTEPRKTLADIASLSGVSLATVSKVLNGRAGVSAARREQILKVLDEEGYRRRGTSIRHRTGLIDIVVRGMDTLWATLILVGAQEEAARAGVGLVVTPSHGRTVGNRHWITSLAQRHSDGLVLVVSRLQPGADNELRKLRIPYVLVDPIGTPDDDVPVIGATNVDGGISATEHLLGLGHRRIAIVTGDRGLACSQDRLAGYRQALDRAGIPVDEELVAYGNFQEEAGYAAADRFLRLKNPPTAIFAGSDLMAFGVYKAVKAHGLSIPGDISVVGFDDVSLCQWVSPPLTTVRQPLQEMAREATRILLEMAYQGIEPPAHKVELPTSLVLRESTAPPKG